LTQDRQSALFVIVVKDETSPINEDVSQFCGINGLRLKVLNIFYGEIELEDVRK